KIDRHAPILDPLQELVKPRRGGSIDLPLGRDPVIASLAAGIRPAVCHIECHRLRRRFGAGYRDRAENQGDESSKDGWRGQDGGGHQPSKDDTGLRRYQSGDDVSTARFPRFFLSVAGARGATPPRFCRSRPPPAGRRGGPPPVPAPAEPHLLPP